MASVFLVGGVSGIAASLPAEAAVIDNPVVSITVVPPNPRLSDPVRTDVTWCVPDSTVAGDTFEIALPAELTRLPRGFLLRDPNGLHVATATIVGQPATVTFTFTDYVDTHTNVCGTAFFESRLDESLVPGTTYDLDFIVNHVTTLTQQITVRPDVTVIGRDVARKGAFFDDPNDECRTVASGCLGWYIETQLGPMQSATVIDDVGAGLSFECSRVSVLLWSVNASGALVNAFNPASVGSTVTITCTPARLEVVGTNIPNALLMRVLVRATPQLLDPAGGVVFANTASVTHVFPNQVVDEDSIVARRRSALVGGNGNGVQSPTPTTTTTTAPPAVQTPTTTTIVVSALPPALPPTPPVVTPPPGAQLPATGSNGTMFIAGMGAFITGASLLMVARRRKPA